MTRHFSSRVTATTKHMRACTVALLVTIVVAGCGGSQQDDIDPDVATVLARRQAHATATTMQAVATSTTAAEQTATADADPFRAIVDVGTWTLIQRDIFARKVVGEIHNTGGGPAMGVKVTVILLDSSGAELERATTVPTGVLPDIPAGEFSPFAIEIDPVVYETIADVQFRVHYESGLGEEWARPEVAVDSWDTDEVVVKVTNTDDRVVRYVRALVVGYDESGNIVDVIGASEKHIRWSILAGETLSPGSTATFRVNTTDGTSIPARTNGIAWAGTCISRFTCG